jgi:hypothetical protein
LITSLLSSLLLGLTLGGCSTKPAAVQTGYLSDYSKLEAETESRVAYRSPELATFDAFIVDPVEVRIPNKVLSEEDRAEAARYFRQRLVGVLETEGLRVTDTPAVGVARVRVALTDVAKSTWWQKLHPVSRVVGAGTGGAAMEAEVIDSVTGQQVAAVVQSGSGNQFNFTAFSTLSDVKSAIDDWAARAGRNLKALRESAGRT